MSVPKQTLTRDTNPPNTGIELAMMYAITAVPKVQLNHTTKCIGVFVERYRELFKSRTKRYLAGIWNASNV